MEDMTRRLPARWLAPLVAAAVLAGAGAAVSAIGNAAHADLAPRSAANLLVDVQKAHLRGLSGTIEEKADLGIPALPGLSAGSDSSTSLTSLLSGSHTLRLWYAGPTRSRLALLSDHGESDLVKNDRSVWLWSSPQKSATHWLLPAAHSSTRPESPMSSLTPQQAADAALKALSPSTRVTAHGTTDVAGRPAHVLSLVPRSADTLVRSVQIAIDGATHVPTRVQVFATGHSTPVFEVGFTSFDPTMPSASRFEFSPPPGTKVTQKSLSSVVPKRSETRRGERSDHPGARPNVVGSGWSSVVVLPAGAATGDQTGGTGKDPMAAMLGRLPAVSGSWGSGHLLSGSLFSAVLTDDGRVAVGAVPPRMLYAALAKQ